MPGHVWHERAAAVFNDYGGWKRPAWYAPDGESRDAAITREVLAVRHYVGLFEGSPLGKIEVCGPDAAEFLNRIYVNDVLTLEPGRVRYGLMLTENGIIMDDGVFARLDEDHYLITTTAANADQVTAWLDEWHQCEWPDLELVIAPVTTQWAVLTLAGPNARALLCGFECDIDLSADAMPHMSIRAGTLEGRPVRMQRVSFTGEASYEVGIPADGAEALLEEFTSKGIAHGLTPTGIEAILILRMEKGYLHVGSDTDGTTNPYDVGFGALVEKKQTDYVGKRSLGRSHDVDPDRRRLVGIEAEDGHIAFRAGAHIVSAATGSRRSEGFVTSACVSPTFGKPIGLAMLKRGTERKGEIVHLFDEGRLSRVRIVEPVFYDPGGERLHG
jgi:sarcosine oxidase subunit alpha